MTNVGAKRQCWPDSSAVTVDIERSNSTISCVVYPRHFFRGISRILKKNGILYATFEVTNPVFGVKKWITIRAVRRRFLQMVKRA